MTNTTFPLTHIQRMTDGIGILEHCIFSTPDRLEGYATDDNARALQLALRLGISADIYLQFLFFARDARGFHQDLNADLTWKDDAAVEEGFGRAMAALAEAGVTSLSPDLKLAAVFVFDRQAGLIPTIAQNRTRAQIISALLYRIQFEKTCADLLPLLIMRKKLKGDMPIELSIDLHEEVVKQADALVAAYRANSSLSWKWYEDVLSYDNGRLPLGLLYAYQITKNNDYLTVALESLDFLLEKTYDVEKDCFSFPGYRGWHSKGAKKALYGQQPIEAGSTVEVCVAAYGVTGQQQYLEYAQKALDWYRGRNISRIDLVNTETGGIKDGIEEWGMNPNEGAESILSYGLACLALRKGAA